MITCSVRLNDNLQNLSNIMNKQKNTIRILLVSLALQAEAAINISVEGFVVGDPGRADQSSIFYDGSQFTLSLSIQESSTTPISIDDSFLVNYHDSLISGDFNIAGNVFTLNTTGSLVSFRDNFLFNTSYYDRDSSQVISGPHREDRLSILAPSTTSIGGINQVQIQLVTKDESNDVNNYDGPFDSSTSPALSSSNLQLWDYSSGNRFSPFDDAVNSISIFSNDGPGSVEFSISTVTIDGNLVLVPEVSAASLIVGLGTFLFTTLRRKSYLSEKSTTTEPVEIANT